MDRSWIYRGDFGQSMPSQPPSSTTFSAARTALKGYGWALGERTKHQTPNTKHQRNTKHQTPNTKEIPNSKLQTATRASSLEFGAWSLEFGASLVFGVWCFMFGVSCSVFGVLIAGFHCYLRLSSLMLVACPV
jgi:hypothetical protein